MLPAVNNKSGGLLVFWRNHVVILSQSRARLETHQGLARAPLLPRDTKHTGQSGDSRLTPIPNLLMPDG